MNGVTDPSTDSRCSRYVAGLAAEQTDEAVTSEAVIIPGRLLCARHPVGCLIMDDGHTAAQQA